MTSVQAFEFPVTLHGDGYTKKEVGGTVVSDYDLKVLFCKHL